MGFIRRILSVGIGLAAAAAAVLLLKRKQQEGVFELDENSYRELSGDQPENKPEEL